MYCVGKVASVWRWSRATIVARELKKSKRVLKLGFWGDRDRRDLTGLSVQAGIV